jgi:hypothetical protein
VSSRQASTSRSTSPSASARELIQPSPLVVEQAQQPVQRPVPPAGQPRSGDPYREREPTAALDDPSCRLRFGADPITSGHFGQQFHGLVLIRHVDVDDLDTGQAAQPRPAGDDHRAACGAREQRPHLRHRTGVVEHHQHAPAGERSPVGGSPLVAVGGDR